MTSSIFQLGLSGSFHMQSHDWQLELEIVQRKSLHLGSRYLTSCSDYVEPQPSHPHCVTLPPIRTAAPAPPVGVDCGVRHPVWKFPCPQLSEECLLGSGWPCLCLIHMQPCQLTPQPQTPNSSNPNLNPSFNLHSCEDQKCPPFKKNVPTLQEECVTLYVASSRRRARACTELIVTSHPRPYSPPVSLNIKLIISKPWRDAPFSAHDQLTVSLVAYKYLCSYVFN